MTLTAADIARYEERAANGETPRLPWKVCGYHATLLGKYRIVEVEASMPDGSVICRTSLPVTPPSKSRPADIVCGLAADDALRAFAAPLLDAPVEGPYSAKDGRVHVMTDDHSAGMGHGIGSVCVMCADQAEAEAIPRERNRAWQRRQKEKGDG